MSLSRRAVFLDRDGVLIEDRGLIVAAEGLRIYPGVPRALQDLHEAGFALIIVTNQAVVARGLLSEYDLMQLQQELERQLVALGAPALDGFYYCPHHPAATLETYRVDCACRKPRPGLLLRAAEERGLDMSKCFMVGDRPTDLQAAHLAGCRGIWIQSGRHADTPIESLEPVSRDVPVAFVCKDLVGAASWILERP